jgi:drug/metabolite transporter (DMT)-like permease
MSRMPTDRPPVSGFLIVVVAASLFGMLGPLSRFAYDAGMQPLPFVAWRGGIGLLAAVSFVAWRVARGAEPLTRIRGLSTPERVTLLVAALLGFALNLAMFISFDLVTIALALLGFYTYPVIVAVVNAALGREAMDRSRVIALLLAVAGMVAVVAAQLDPTSGIKVDVLGLGLALVAAGCQAAFVIISRNGYPSVPSSQAMAVVLATTVVCAVIIAAFTGTGEGAPWKFARIKGSHRSWTRRASSQRLPSAVAHSEAISAGISFDATETTPSPPIARIASVAASSPLRTETSRGRSRQITASCSRLPEASLTATTRGCSASRRNVSASTFVPVRPGTL